ncbi:MAG: hypothetical protein JNG88_15125, partial [Phycisphaerales bacterium]|nr:hypothetical protein [Phycisphaerales bacterium]
EDTGTLAGAPYRIDIPAEWNGELVVLAHGFEPVGVPRDTPWPADPATLCRHSHRTTAIRSDLAMPACNCTGSSANGAPGGEIPGYVTV